MANLDTETDANAGGGPPPSPGAGGAPGGGAPGGPPQGGGPILAALARNQGQPQISAPGQGNMANAMNKANMALQLLQEAQIGLPNGSPLWKAVNHAIGSIGKQLPQGGPTEGVQQTGLRDLLRQALQSGFLGRIMQQLQGQRGQRGGGADAGQGPSPNLAMQGTPATPLPGA